jgi:iron complex outermembrane receptor protein
VASFVHPEAVPQLADAQVSYVNVRSDFDVTGFPPGAFGGAFPDGVRQDLGLDEDRARAELTALWTGLKQHWLTAGLGAVFESSDTTEDVRNYTVRQGFPVPTGRFAERGGIDDVPIFPDEDRTIFFAYLQDEWDFAPDWSLTTGVRIDEYSDFGTTVNPRVGNTAYRLTTKLLYGRAGGRQQRQCPVCAKHQVYAEANWRSRCSGT